MVTVLSYNTHCVPYITSTGHVDAICSYIGKLSKAYRPDIVALSEVFQPWVRDRVLQQLNRQLEGTWKASPVVHPARVTVSSGLLVLWNTGTVVRNGTMHSVLFSRCCQMDCLSNKGAISIPFRAIPHGKTLNLVHTHMQAWEPTVLCSQVRKSQFGQLAKLLHTVNREGEPNVLVVGDFNENPRENFAQENSLHMPANFLKTYDQYFYDHAYSSSPSTTIAVASIENDTGPSDHKAVVIKNI